MTGHRVDPDPRASAAIPSPALLAYVGDAVYELWLRRWAVERWARDTTAPGAVHARIARYLTAEGQDRLLAVLWPQLTDEEQGVVRRGRNARVRHRPRHLAVGAYRRSTGLEALLGYLHLAGRGGRLDALLRPALERDEVGEAKA